MIALKLPDIRTTTAKLFAGEDFDAFLVSEVSLSTFCSFQIDGRIPADYYSAEEQESLTDKHNIAWKQLRPLMYQLIKGNRLPGQFKIVFRLAGHNVEKFLKQTGLSYTPEQIGGLFLNLRYHNGQLSAYTGTSLAVFDLSKQLDQEWDRMVKGFLKQKQIPFEEEK
ncbi:MAG: hypothetical protein IKT45_10125 [Lachnospiraceae bacterium]|nr:hypothetical protein [Lachnospiraceae bacterium]